MDKIASSLRTPSTVHISSFNKDTEQAAINFEQYFIKKLLDNAKRTLPGDQILGQNEQRDLMIDMQNQAISKELASSKSFGIADLLIQQAKFK
jgi:Rod binding domain-containing protein